MKLSRKRIREILHEEKMNALIEALADPEYKSEMRQFSETRGGKDFIKAGASVRKAGSVIRDTSLNQTGESRRMLETVATFVESLGNALEGINSLNEEETTAGALPTVAEFKAMAKAVERLER
jgi:RNA polymerase-interacting CarD/CdnL/TRCF family regulator